MSEKDDRFVASLLHNRAVGDDETRPPGEEAGTSPSGPTNEVIDAIDKGNPAMHSLSTSGTIRRTRGPH